MTAEEVARDIFDSIYCEDMHDDETLYLHNMADAEELIIDYAKQEKRKLLEKINADEHTVYDVKLIIQEELKTLKDG